MEQHDRSKAETMWRVDPEEYPNLGRWYINIQRQPSWALKTALLAGALVIVVPLVVLAIAAIVVGVAVFFVMSLIAGLLRIVRDITSFGRPGDASNPQQTRQGDGRVNVRIMSK